VQVEFIIKRDQPVMVEDSIEEYNNSNNDMEMIERFGQQSFEVSIVVVEQPTYGFTFGLASKKPPKKILLVGCGREFLLKLMHEKLDANFIAIDAESIFDTKVNAGCLNEIRISVNKGEPIESDFLHIGPFDEIYCNSIIQLIDKPQCFVAKVAASLVFGGKIHFTSEEQEERYSYNLRGVKRETKAEITLFEPC